jgi:hypothetical protein
MSVYLQQVYKWLSEQCLCSYPTGPRFQIMTGSLPDETVTEVRTGITRSNVIAVALERVSVCLEYEVHRAIAFPCIKRCCTHLAWSHDMLRLHFSQRKITGTTSSSSAPEAGGQQAFLMWILGIGVRLTKG